MGEDASSTFPDAPAASFFLIAAPRRGAAAAAITNRPKESGTPPGLAACRKRKRTVSRLVADSTRTEDHAATRRHDPLAHDTAVARIVVGVIATMPTAVSAAPVVRAHADAKRPNVNANAARVRADADLRTGRNRHGESYGCRACKKKRLHGDLLWFVALVTQRLRSRIVSPGKFAKPLMLNSYSSWTARESAGASSRCVSP